MRPGMSPVIVAVLSSAPTLILPVSAPPPPFQYTLYPDTVAGGVQETVILVTLTCTALIIVGESAAVGEKMASRIATFVCLNTTVMSCSN